MSVNVVLNGVSYTIPDPGNDGWGQNLTDYFVAIASGLLQKAGGTFSLTAEVDFGATYGLKSTYFKSRATNPASTGQLRLGNAEGIYWRNAANSANLGLLVNASDLLEFNGTTIQPAGNYITALTGDVAASGPGSAVATISAGVITNSMINASAAIAYSKLALTGSIVNADISASAAIAYSKLALTGSIVNADISASAAIAYSKLSLTGSILNADISASAAIALSKLAALTASRVLQSSAGGVIEVSSVTTTELGYLSGVTSAIQTQIDGKTAKSTLTTKGDIYVATGASTPARLGVGSDGQILTADSSQSTGVKWANVGASTAPNIQKFTSTGTTTGYLFTVTAANATVGATYTNNGNTYTVLATISGATQLFCSQASAPQSSGTLTKASGTGDATITFSAATALATYTKTGSPLYIRVRMVGGGGGGTGSGTASTSAAGAGGNSVFGTALLTANGGLGGSYGFTVSGTGGTATIGAGATGTSIQGATGTHPSLTQVSGTQLAGGSGGVSWYGGAGAGGIGSNGAAGDAAIANSGSGGGGGASTSQASNNTSGGGGGAGGFIDAIITSPSSTYVYAVGAAGSAGSAGTNGAAGGAGGSGYIEVTEYYQ